MSSAVAHATGRYTHLCLSVPFISGEKHPPPTLPQRILQLLLDGVSARCNNECLSHIHAGKERGESRVQRSFERCDATRRDATLRVLTMEQTTFTTILLRFDGPRRRSTFTRNRKSLSSELSESRNYSLGNFFLLRCDMRVFHPFSRGWLFPLLLQKMFRAASQR